MCEGNYPLQCHLMKLVLGQRHLVQNSQRFWNGLKWLGLMTVWRLHFTYMPCLVSLLTLNVTFTTSRTFHGDRSWARSSPPHSGSAHSPKRDESPLWRRGKHFGPRAISVLPLSTKRCAVSPTSSVLRLRSSCRPHLHQLLGQSSKIVRWPSSKVRIPAVRKALVDLDWVHLVTRLALS